MAQTLQPGTPLQGGKYVIKQVLGQGGFGITYLAEQVSLGRDVAIKEFFMKDGCLRDDTSLHVTVPSTGSAAQVEQYRNKFLKEARTLAGLEHPHIVRVIDVFEENGTVYYSMSYLPNGSLKSRVKSGGKLTEAEALRYVGQVANALKYMHDRNLCHYDVKPDNILLDVNDNAVLIDFGISKNYDAQGKETSTTPIGLSEGFAPIEQYQGINDFSPASDVYALGATLYYLVMGKIPPAPLLIVQGERLVFDKKVSRTTKNLIVKSMQVSVKDRLDEVDAFLSSSKKIKKDNRAKNIVMDESTVVVNAISDTDEIYEPKEIDTAKDFAQSEKRIISKKKRIYILSLITLALFGTGFGVFLLIEESEPLPLTYDPVKRLQEDMVFVEGGSFTMGATAEQGDEAEQNEFPVHKDSLNSFYICKYEVTQGLWKAVMGYNPVLDHGNIFTGDLERPVSYLYPEDVRDFLIKLNEMTGKKFRIPTEAEWEFAARGGNKSSGFKYSGSNYRDDVAWYNENSDYKLHPVGAKFSNELGLYDMSGNVWELCLQVDTNYPVGSEDNLGVVSRGGCSIDKATKCRVSSRDYWKWYDETMGLRLAI